MGKINCEYEIDSQRYIVDIKSSLLLGRVTIRINDDKFVLKSFPFHIARQEPFMIGDKRCVLTVSKTGKLKID